jgi:hypothetical protein
MGDSGNLNSLLDLLKHAVKIGENYAGGYTEHFKSTRFFLNALNDSIRKLSQGDTRQLGLMLKWFTPTSEWGHFVGPDGYVLGKKINSEISELLNTVMLQRVN